MGNWVLMLYGSRIVFSGYGYRVYFWRGFFNIFVVVFGALFIK